MAFNYRKIEVSTSVYTATDAVYVRIGKHTSACCTISRKALLAGTTVRTITVGAIRILSTWTGIGRTLIDI